MKFHLQLGFFKKELKKFDSIVQREKALKDDMKIINFVNHGSCVLQSEDGSEEIVLTFI